MNAYAQTHNHAHAVSTCTHIRNITYILTHTSAHVGAHMTVADALVLFQHAVHSCMTNTMTHASEVCRNMLADAASCESRDQAKGYESPRSQVHSETDHGIIYPGC
jgi:hypothetical protein